MTRQELSLCYRFVSFNLMLILQSTVLLFGIFSRHILEFFQVFGILWSFSRQSKQIFKSNERSDIGLADFFLFFFFTKKS